MTHAPVETADFVADWIKGNAQFFPDKLATHDLASGRKRSYADLHRRVGMVAGMLRAHGVGVGDRVSVLAMNSTDMLDLQLACWRLGAIHVPLNFRLSPAELAYIVGDAAPKVLVVDTVFEAVARDLTAQSPVQTLIMMDGLGGDTEFERAVAEAEPVMDMVEQPRSALCMLMYSSGTTGRPKGVTFTHDMMVCAVLNTAPGMEMSNHMVGLSAMPLFHIGGLMAFSISCFYFGATTVIQRSFEPGETLATIDDPDIGVTHILLVPAMFNALKTHPDQAKTDFSRMKLTLAGAEAVPESLVHWWRDQGLIVQEVYGLTETCGAVCFVPKADLPGKVGTAGRVLPFCRVRLVGDDGCDVTQGEPGELWVRGGNVTSAYWNRPDANEESFEGAWFKTGDIARMDADGCLTIEDRVKDMYISGGENVYPAEVENVLYTLEEIHEVAVIGVPDPHWGEAGCAVVVTRDRIQLSRDQIVEHCARSLARFKHPSHVHHVDQLPRNATGKVLKYQLRETVTRELGLDRA